MSGSEKEQRAEDVGHPTPDQAPDSTPQNPAPTLPQFYRAMAAGHRQRFGHDVQLVTAETAPGFVEILGRLCCEGKS